MFPLWQVHVKYVDVSLQDQKEGFCHSNRLDLG